jgi:hypothetical protein
MATIEEMRASRDKFFKRNRINFRLRARLRDLIHARGLTEREFADRIPLNFGHWENVRDGLSLPKKWEEQRITMLLDGSPQSIFLAKFITHDSDLIVQRADRAEILDIVNELNNEFWDVVLEHKFRAVERVKRNSEERGDRQVYLDEIEPQK